MKAQGSSAAGISAPKYRAQPFAVRLRRVVLDPPPDGVGVVGAGVEDAVPDHVVGDADVPLPAGIDVLEGEDQHLHPGDPELVHHLPDVQGDGPEVLGDDREAGELPRERAEEPRGGGRHPPPVRRRRRAGRDLPVRDEAAEVVDPDVVHAREGPLHPLRPPREAVPLQGVPAVERDGPRAGRSALKRSGGAPETAVGRRSSSSRKYSGWSQTSALS